MISGGEVTLKLGQPPAEKQEPENPEPGPGAGGRPDQVGQIVAFVAGLGVTWLALLALAIPSIVHSIPSRVEQFVPQFTIFLVLAFVGAKLSRGGEACPRVAGEVLTFSGVAMFLVLVVALLWGMKGMEFAVESPTFWFKVVYACSVVWIGCWSLRTGRAIGRWCDADMDYL